MKLRILIYLITPIYLLLQGCANVSSPTGGKKDETPPKLIRAIPTAKSLNYNGKEVILVFDEFIQLENIKNELLITPDIEGNYEYKPIKNGVRLTFEKPFRPNTTYTFNFRRGIKDVTEKNVADSAKLVFSTGSFLDTLSISGIVTDLLTGKPIENAIISLYREGDTLTILKHKPYYFTKTDKNGNYLLENIKQDSYQIYALEDRNNNLKYDPQLQQSEKIAFRNSSIKLDSTFHKVNFMISKMDANKPKIAGRSATLQYIDLEFDEGLQKANAQVQQANNQTTFQLIDEGRAVRIYNTTNRNDSIPVAITAIDSAGNTLEQTVNIKFAEAKKSKQETEAPEKLEVKISPADGEKILKNFEYTLTFSKPITRYDLSQVQLLADTITPIALEEKQDFIWDPYHTRLTLRKNINITQSVRFIAPKGTFFGVQGDTAQAIKTTHGIKDPENYGSIGGKITTTEKFFVVQLLDENYKIIAQQRNQADYKFTYLNAGKYIVRVIIDSNNNGQWDQGSFEQKLLPEPIFFGPKLQPLKENWDLVDQDFRI